jgi:pimeloyl-ACP methyl ester carboxylesterase
MSNLIASKRIALATALCLAIGLPAMAAEPPLEIAREGYFYTGIQRLPDDGGVTGQMFVEYQIPAHLASPYPIVMIHGSYQNGSNFLGTPDDREGWREYFARRGYAVYVVDQPSQGRSNYAPANGSAGMPNTTGLERQFTAIEKFNLWPTAKLHTQWPGTGTRGDAVFDQMEASQQPTLRDNVRMDALNRAAGRQLLERIGPAILLTHSRSGPIGWVIANDTKSLVKGIIALEPGGPPFFDTIPVSMNGPAPARENGVAYDTLTYDPPVTSRADFDPVQETQPQAPGLERCMVPSKPHKLVNLTGIPVMILTSESSYHAAYDHCTSQFLTQSGVANDFIPLEDRGIHGNGHMMMLEKNNLEISALIEGWIQTHIK